jgi:hypothetical protein
VLGLVAGALWMLLLWGWLTGYRLLDHALGKVMRVSAFTVPSSRISSRS